MFTKLRDTLSAVLRRKRFESELDAELADHIAKYTDELVAQGLPLEDAQRRSRLEFGSVGTVKEEVRDSRAVTLADSASRHLRFACRALLRTPAFTLTVIATLAVGLGATTAGFSVVNAVLLRDLPYSEPEQLYRLYSMTPEGLPEGYVAPRDMPTLYKDHPAVQSAAIGFQVDGRLIDAAGMAHSLTAYYVTEQFFEVFRTDMYLGARFRSELRPGQTILAYSTWRDLFGSDPDIVGKPIVAEDGPRTIVGVAPPGFDVPRRPAYWSLFLRGVETLRGYDAYIRLRPGITAVQFEEQLKVLGAELGPDPTTRRNVEFVARPMLESVVGDLRPTVLILFGASAILLLIACINVANLMLSRGIQRTRELAIREALGARRAHVVGTLWIESFLLSAIGGAAGLALGVAGVRLLMRFAPEGLPRLDSVPVDERVLWFGLLAPFATALITGLAPAIRIARTDLRALIQDGGHGSSGTGAQHRMFGTLVVAEIALSVVLTIGAGLLVRSYINLSNTDPGFNPDRLLVVSMQLSIPPAYEVETGRDGRPRIKSGSYEPIARFYDQLMNRIRALPGVAQVTAGSGTPLRGTTGAVPGSVQVVGQPVNDATGALPQVSQRSVNPDYFRVMGIPILAGRSLEESDTKFSPGVAVVNEAYVKRFLAGQDPIGTRLNLPDQFYKAGKPGFQYAEFAPEQVVIVGVVSNVKYVSLAETEEPVIHLSNDQFTLRNYNVFVRAADGDPGTLVPAIREEIKAMNPTQGAKFTTYPPLFRAALAKQRMEMTLLVAFGSIALLLAAVGIYGLMSYSVAQRTKEMAVRAAMGATGRELGGLIVRRGIGLGIAGTVLGVIGAVALRNVVASQLFGVGSVDPQVFLTVPAVLLAVALLSSLIPARRAARTDPSVMLRTD